MKKKISVIILSVVIIISICSYILLKFHDYASQAPVRGGELYNAEIAGIENCQHRIPILSKENLSLVQNVRLLYDGGAFKYSYDFEKTDIEVKGYSLFYLVLKFNNIKFDNLSLAINKIILEKNGEMLEILPQKCELYDISKYTVNSDNLFYSSTPSKIPYDMNEIPVYLDAYNDVKIRDVLLTNNDIKIKNIVGNDRNKGYSVNLNKGTKDSMVNIKTNPITDKNKYIQFITDIVVVYICEDKEYCIVSPVSTVFNVLTKEKIKEYLSRG